MAAQQSEGRQLQAPESTSKLVQVAKDVFAGTMGGISVTMVGHPFGESGRAVSKGSMAGGEAGGMISEGSALLGRGRGVIRVH
jgi:hypothetical protein